MRKTGLILILAGFLSAGAAAPPPVTTIAQVLTALDRGDAQAAQRLSDAALQQEAQDARSRASLLLYRGLASELLGAHEAALGDLTRAIESRALPSEELGQAYLQRGFLREGQGLSDEAISDYGAVIAQKGYSTATAFNNRGNIYFRRGRLMDAQQDYLAALAAEGGQSQYSYYGLGRIAESEGDKRAARDFYAKAVALDAGYAAASGRLAALGGPPTAAADPAERILLRPPVTGDVSETGPGGAIVLRPPPPKKDNPSEAPAAPPQSAFMPVNASILRPALDQSDVRAGVRLGGEVQLGAWRSTAEAWAAWDQAKVRAQGALDGLTPQIRVVDVPGKGRYFRLRVRSGPGQSGAQMCARLTAKALDCFAVRD